MLDLVEKSTLGDCIEDLAEIEHQQVRHLSSIQSSGQVLYCVEQLGLAGVVCSESMLEFDEDVVPRHLCVLIQIRIKGEVGTVKLSLSLK